MLQQVTLVCLLLILNHGVSNSSGQVSESLRLPERGENCVIRVDCEGGQDVPRISGAPGKKGPVGPIGPKGTKGEIGLRGQKGEKGRNGPVGPIGSQGLKGEIGVRGPKGEIGSSGPVGRKGRKGNLGVRGPKGESGIGEMFGVINSRSCIESALKYGVEKTGYYLMRGPGVGVVVFHYCDFQVYEGVANCGELETDYGVSTPGYYLMGSGGSSSHVFCDFRVYEGITSCDGLSRKTPITLGYYRLGNNGFTLCPDLFTCDQLHQFNETNIDGIYTMSPGVGSYRVHCSFSSGAAVTEVWHDSMQEIKISSCEPAGCYTRTPQYEINQNSILKIIENSRECRQYIKWRCRGSVLFANYGLYAWWVSRQGDKMTYWGGATSRRDKYCACGETGTCINNRYKCNCDNNDDSITTQDEGFLTNKSKLPVKTLRFGDATGGEAGWHTLGKLECMGQA